jgi:cytochrome P450/NADPH-cytochrome P450 reductase
MFNSVDVLEQFSSVEMPWDHFIECLPKISPRFYSISSSSLVSPEKIDITVGVHQVKTSMKIFKGLCSNYLAKVSPNEDQIAVFVRRSTFRLPQDERPIILIAGGTGIAPFKAFIKERKYLKQKGVKLGDAFLFYGCRDPNGVCYKELLQEAERDQILTKIFIVYSDVPNPDGSGPMFVADKVLLEGDIVYDAFQKGGNVYVCGGAKGFGDTCISSLQRVYTKFSGDINAENFIAQLRATQRFHEDLAD